MRIAEIYSSIQGETQYAGLPCTLVRTTGCDLRCGYCDSAFAFYGGKDMTLEEILAEVERLGRAARSPDRGRADAPAGAAGAGGAARRSGVPGHDRDLGRPSARLPAAGSGADRRREDARVGRIAPQAVGAARDAATSGRRQVRPLDENDYRWAQDLIRRYELGARTEVLLSPVHGRLDPQELVAWMLRDRLPARLNLQLHKYVWEPEARGV